VGCEFVAQEGREVGNPARAGDGLRLTDGELRCGEVDVAPAQCGQFADAQASESSGREQRAVGLT
jgi:hypothetical protein